MRAKRQVLFEPRRFWMFACLGTFGAYDEIPFDDNARLKYLCMEMLVYNTEWRRSCLYLVGVENIDDVAVGKPLNLIPMMTEYTLSMFQ